MGNNWFRSSAVSAAVGGVLAVYGCAWLYEGASLFSSIFLTLMKMISVPIIFFALFTAVQHVVDLPYKQKLVRATVGYILITTGLASSVALITCLFFGRPVVTDIMAKSLEKKTWSIQSFINDIIPENVLGIIGNNNVLTCVIFAILLAFCTAQLPEKERNLLNKAGQALNSLFLNLATICIKYMPFFIWAFALVFVYDLYHGQASFSQVQNFILLVGVAFFLHAVILMPLIVYIKTKLNPWNVFCQSLPSVNLAFWTQSSSVTVPTSLEIVTNKFGLPKKEAQFLAPICAAINMNGSAISIYVTVYSVMTAAGIQPTLGYSIGGVFLVALAAMGNAGVPMGAYFMSTAILSSTDVSMSALGAIFPVMIIVDKVETSANIWVDLCIMRMISSKLKNRSKDTGSGDKPPKQVINIDKT